MIQNIVEGRQIFLLWNVHFGARPRVPPPGCCGGEAPQTRGPGGSKDARETIGFSTRHGIALAREPTLDIMMRARDRLWNWLGHILRLEDRVIRRVLMNSVRPTPNSLFGDFPDLDSRKAAEIAKDREKWKILRPSKRC